MIIDLRSDTVTKPSEKMLAHMAAAPVGDDVFGQDPTVNKLEALAACLFGKEAGLFCPSGTMSNQIAIKAQTQPGDEIICDANAHIYYYEGGGIAFNSGCTTKTLNGNRGVFTAKQLTEVLRPADLHFPNTSLVSIENTCNRGGGKIFDFQEIQKIRQVCLSNNLNLHLDGARLFNALVASNTAPSEMGLHFDTISICLSKGLGAPVGSVLIGSNETIAKGRRIRKVLGGGMRQAGYLAAAGIFALENNVTRLEEDHKAALNIQSMLEECCYVNSILPVETNIVVFELDEKIVVPDFLNHLSDAGILAFQVGPNRVRFVTHLDLPPNTLEQLRFTLLNYGAGSSF
jgi:threonine aldolase